VPRERRKSFTLIEILSVIAIIAVLVGILVFGIKHIGNTARVRTTHVAMQNLQNMLAERQMAGGLQDVNQIFTAQAWTTAGQPAGKLGISGDASTLTAALAQGANAIEAQNQLGATLLVMNKLKAIPANAKMLAALPADATKLVGVQVAGTNPPTAIQAPVMLDGWGHPILYVPGGGLVGIFVTGDSGKPQAKSISSPDGRGFWVSAGADGYFGLNPGSNGVVGNPPPDADDVAAGDDNIYSFEQ